MEGSRDELAQVGLGRSTLVTAGVLAGVALGVGVSGAVMMFTGQADESVQISAAPSASVPQTEADSTAGTDPVSEPSPHSTDHRSDHSTSAPSSAVATAAAEQPKRQNAEQEKTSEPATSTAPTEQSVSQAPRESTAPAEHSPQSSAPDAEQDSGRPEAQVPDPAPAPIEQGPTVIRYIVQDGDTLSRISRSHDVPLGVLIELNQMQSNPNLLISGTPLIIPEGING